MNLQPYESFEDWCEDKETARKAELLYSHIDNLELYPGLMAECTKPPIPGSGVCPGQTTGRGILDDAVALVRGDRFLSYDFNSFTLTDWGVSKLGDLPGGAYGGMLPRLVFNGLPTFFTGTSSYVLLPFYTPSAAQGILKGNKVIDHYDTKRPPKDCAPAIVYTQGGCKDVLGDRDSFRSSYPEPKAVQSKFFEEGFEANVSRYFSANAAQQIRKSSLKYPGKRRAIDIVRDVTNITPIFWLAERFAIPIKSPETPRGVMRIPELFDGLMVTSMYQNFNVLPAHEWKLRAGYDSSAPMLRQILKLHLETQQGFKEKIVDWFEKGSVFEVGPDADRLFHALNSTGKPIGDLVEECIRFAAPVASAITQQASLLIDLYLSAGYEEHKARVIELAHRNDEASVEELQGFVYEGMRHAGAVPGVARIASTNTTIDDGARGSVPVRANQKVIAATSVAAMDPTAFSMPEKLKPNRPAAAYELLLGPSLSRVLGPAVAAILKEVFKLKNVRRAQGKPGQFTTVEQDFAGIRMRAYLDANARESPYPTNLMLEYDEEGVQTNGMANGNSMSNGNGMVNGYH